MCLFFIKYNSYVNKMERQAKLQLKELRKQLIEKKRETTNTNRKRENYCKKCGIRSLIESNGNIICNKCGLFHSNVIQTEESINYSNNLNDPTRVGTVNNYLIPSANKGSIYGFSDLKNKNSSISHSNMIRCQNYWSLLCYKDNNMLSKFDIMTSICNNAGFNSLIIENAKEIFFKIHNQYSPRSNRLDALMASSVIISCKKHDTIYNLEQIADIFGLDKKDLVSMLNIYQLYWSEICNKEEQQQYELAKESLEDKSKVDNIVVEPIYIQNESDNNLEIEYKNYMSYLSIDNKYLDKILLLHKWIENNEILIEHIPISIMASIIYVIVDVYELKSIKKKKIALVCNTSPITINKCHGKLKPYYDEIKKILL